MADDTGKTVLDDFCYAELIEKLDIVKQSVTDSNNESSKNPSTRELLQNCIKMLSDGKNALERMEKRCCTSSIIVADLISYEIGVVASFKHCSESNIIYGDLITNVKELLTEMFKKTSEIQTLYFSILEKVNFDFTIDGDLNLLLDALKHIWHATKAVQNASNKIMAINLKVYTTISHRYSIKLKESIVNDEPINFLCDEIKKKLTSFDESSLKLLAYLMSVLVKLCSFGRVLESHNSLVELILFLNSYWLPETQAVIKERLFQFVEQIVLISDEKFVTAFQSICYGVIHNNSSSQKVSALYIAMLLLKRIVKTPCEQQAFDILCIIFQLIKCTDFAMCYSSINMYDPLLINLASVILVSDCSLFEKVEKILIKNVLDIEYWSALFSCDLWIIITRYLPPNMCNIQFLKLARLFETLTGLQCFTQCPQHIYLQMLLKRHFALIDDKRQIVNCSPEFKMSSLKSAVGILHVPSLSKYNSLSELIKIIDILPHQENIDHLNEDILHLWSCIEDEHPSHFICALIEVSISSKLLLQTVIHKVPKILNTCIDDDTTEMKRFKLQLIQAIILFEPFPETLVMDIFFKYLCDPHPLVQQWAVETIVYFSSVTGNQNKLISIFSKRPEIRTIITDYLEMKIGHTYNYDECVLFFEQLSQNGKFQHKCSFDDAVKLTPRHIRITELKVWRTTECFLYQQPKRCRNSMLISLKEKGGTRLPTDKSMVIIGDNQSGKTTLVAKLQGIDDLTKGIGLEYAYIDIRDDYKEDHTKLNVWVQDGNPKYSFLLKFALSEKNFKNTLIMFVVSMKTPWNIMDQLESWATLLQDYIDNLGIPSEDFLEYRQKCVKKWNEYIEENIGDKNEYWEPALGEGVLTRNLGLDIIVVVTMTDYITVLEKENDYKDEHFDFIQQVVRKFCLQYGASLFYTSAKEDKNCDLLYKFITHKIYNFPFKTPALIVEKDAVFIPAGWDSMKKISILYDNMQTIRPEEFYNSVITKVNTRKAFAKDHETQAEDEQVFLNKQLGLLNQSANQQSAIGVPRQDSVMRSLTSVSKSGDRRTSLTSQVPGSPTKKIDSTKSTNASTPGEGVLANFFNSLLHKKSNQSPVLTKTAGELSGSKSLSLEKTEFDTDTVAELDKLAKRTFNLSYETSAEARQSDSIQEQNSATFGEKSSSEC